MHELGQISASLPLIDEGSLKIKLLCHTGCDDLQDPRPAWIHTLKAMSLMPSGLLSPIQKAWDVIFNSSLKNPREEWDDKDRDRLSEILKETQQNFDKWTESTIKNGYICPLKGLRKHHILTARYKQGIFTPLPELQPTKR